MDGMSASGVLVLSVPLLALHLLAIALTKALEWHSRSLLEELCEARGRMARARDVEHWAHKTERATECLAVLTGLLLAALLGVGLRWVSFSTGVAAVILPVLVIGLLGYVIAGVVGKVFAESIIDRLWPLAAGLRALAWPLTFGLRQVERLLESLSGRSPPLHRPAHLQVEVQFEEAANVDDDDQPALAESARSLLQQAILLTRRDTGEVMTPRSAIVSLPSTVSAAEAAATFRRTGLSRVPVFQESRDDIVGVLYAKDLFARMTEARAASTMSPHDLVRPALFVPESKNAYDLLEEMRIGRRHFAIVLDEYGSVAGVVSLEDLLEELVGPIEDEHDVPAPADPIRELGGSRYEVDARLTLEELNERLGLHLATDADFQTIGGLVFHELGRLPAKGDRVNGDGAAFTVVDVSDHTIRRIVIDLSPEVSVVETAGPGQA